MATYSICDLDGETVTYETFYMLENATAAAQVIADRYGVNTCVYDNESRKVVQEVDPR
jgi:hypothetical protein